MLRCYLEKCESLLKLGEYSKIFCPSCQAFKSFSQINYFSLYQVPQGFSVDKEALTARYKSLQSVLHPDILRSKGINDQVYSKILQEAYRTLDNDISRAQYLLGLLNIDTDHVGLDTEFLEQQLETRSKVETSTQAELKVLIDHTNLAYQSIKTSLTQCFDSSDLDQARVLTAKLNFTYKILQRCQEKLEIFD